MTDRTYDIDEMIRLRRDGWTQQEIAAELGCSQAAISANLGGMPAGGYPVHAMLGLDPEMESILTEAFRKHMGYCPVADGIQGAEIPAE